MIVVSVHLMSAVTRETTQLGKMLICNDDTGDFKHRNYNSQIKRKPDFKDVTRIGRLENHNAPALTIWHLVARMLKGMGYAGNGAASDVVDVDATMIEIIAKAEAGEKYEARSFLAGARWQAAQLLEGDNV